MCHPLKDTTDTARTRQRFLSVLWHSWEYSWNCDYSYEQFIVIGDGAQTLKQLDQKRRRMQSLSLSSRENAFSAEAMTDFMNESISNCLTPMKAHYHIHAWTGNNITVEELDTKVVAAVSQAAETAYRSDPPDTGTRF